MTSKVGQTDLVSAVQSWFTGRFRHERLQVSVCSSYDCATLVDNCFDFYILTPCNLEKCICQLVQSCDAPTRVTTLFQQ